MKQIRIKTAILVISMFGLTHCASQNDEDMVWLLAILDPVAPVETGGSNASISSPTDGSENENDGDETLEIPQDRPFSMEVNDIRGEADFIFENTTEYPIRIQVRDPYSPVTGSMVQIIEMNPNGTQNVVFRATSDENGNIQGSFTIPNREKPVVQIQVFYQGEEFFFEVNLEDLLEVNRDIYIWIDKIAQIENPDRDGDGIPNDKDDYPDDASRATKLTIPAESYYTVSYEDLYPKQGDADFNDYVVRVVNEEDLNAKGEVVRIRGRYTHVAKGAGYNHTLHLRLPEEARGNYTLTRKNPNGNEYFRDSFVLESKGSIHLLPESNTTIPQSNTASSQTFRLGDSSEFELVLEEPIPKMILGKSPYDLYIFVKNTNREIHFLGFYKNEDGSDRYLDPAGFPWALLVPGDFHWPLERKNIHDGYPNFHPWYTSQGQNHRDWYESPVSEYLFSY